MKKIFVLLFFLIALVACSKKDNETKYNGDNINTPFIEISPNLQKKVEEAFKKDEIIRERKSAQENYSIDERKKKTVSWQESMTNSNKEDYHFWLTCYYEKDEIVVLHVERSDKDLWGHSWALYRIYYDLGEYSFKVYGKSLENYTYILIYKDNNLYEMDYAYNNGIINDNDVKEIYKHYIDSKFLKNDGYYNNYKYDPENIPSEYD